LDGAAFSDNLLAVRILLASGLFSEGDRGIALEYSVDHEHLPMMEALYPKNLKNRFLGLAKANFSGSLGITPHAPLYQIERWLNYTIDAGRQHEHYHPRIEKH